MMKTTNSKQRYYIYMLLLLPLLLVIITGVGMLYYHGNGDLDLLLYGYDGHTWILWHKIGSVIMLPLVLLHLFKGTSWMKKLFTAKIKGKHKKSNIALFIVFALAVSTSLVSWLIFAESEIAIGLRGVHNKFGLLLIILCIVHLFNYWRVVVAHFKRGNR